MPWLLRDGHGLREVVLPLWHRSRVDSVGAHGHAYDQNGHAEKLAEATAKKANELLVDDYKVALLVSASNDIPTMLGARGRTSIADSTAAGSSHGGAGTPKAPSSSGGGAGGAGSGDVEMEPVPLAMNDFVDLADAPSAELLAQHLAAAAQKYRVEHRIATIKPLTSMSSVTASLVETRRARDYAHKINVQCDR